MDLQEMGPFGINIANAATLYDALQVIKRQMPDFSELLTLTDLSVKEIAHQLGYSAPNNFNRAFRKIAGVTPGTFRRERRPKA